VALFTTVAAGESLGIWAVLREVSNLFAAAALHSLSRARFRALTGDMARLLAIFAREPIHAFLLTVASTVADLFADGAFNFNTSGGFSGLLLTTLLDVSLK
jgi:hypothetical protein